MRRGGWGFLLMLACLAGIPILEVWLLVEVGSHIGALPTVAILVAEVLLGGWLLRREGTRAWRALDQALKSGTMPTGELADAAFVLVGGVLLMLPGFFTDVLGLFFLLPFTRPLARHVLGFVIARRVQRSGLAVRRPVGEEGLIEGEAVEVTDPAPSTQDPRVIRGEVDDGR